ncbi:MAG: GspH/FimT family protein, partial [Gammaproteobacteria bacterium]
DLLARTRANGAMMQLRALLHLARSSAITLRRDVTVCGSPDGRRCSAEWTDMPAMVFVDLDQDRTLDSDESLLGQSSTSRAARIRWRASGNRAYLRYKPDGGVKEYGHFLYCPEGGDLRFARQLIINATGRPRHGLDSNGDGITDDPNVVAPECPP